MSTIVTMPPAPTPTLLDVLRKTVSECMQDEFDLLVKEAISELRQGSSARSLEKRDDDVRRNIPTKITDQEQVSLLQSVGTTINRGQSMLTDDNVEDERTDFLSERDQTVERVPSKIAFKPCGRSYILQVGEYDLVPVREGDTEEILKKYPTSSLQRPSSLFQKQKSSLKKTRPDKTDNRQLCHESNAPVRLPHPEWALDPAEVVVQGRRGFEILKTGNGNRPAATSAPEPKKRWGLLSRRN